MTDIRNFVWSKFAVGRCRRFCIREGELAGLQEEYTTSEGGRDGGRTQDGHGHGTDTDAKKAHFDSGNAIIG